MLPFRSILRREPLKPLLRAGMYPVVFFVVTEFDGPVTSVQLKAMRRGMRDFPPRVRIEEYQREDGGWDTVAADQNEAQQALLTLFKLADFGGNSYDAVVQLGSDFLYGLQQPDGLFPFGLAENGAALWVLYRLGYTYNRDNNELIRRLLTLQRADGGWGQSDPDDPDSESHMGVTINVLHGLCCFEAYRDAPEIVRAGKFLIERVLKKTQTQTFRRPRHWQVLRYEWDLDGLLGWPMPKTLQILSSLGYKRQDDTVEQLFKWVTDAQLENGLWGDEFDGHEWLSIAVLRAVRQLCFPEHRPRSLDELY